MNKQPRMIDADKLLEWLKQKNERIHNELVHQLNFLDWEKVAPDPIPLPTIKPGDRAKYTEMINVLVVDDVKIVSLETNFATFEHEGILCRVPLGRLELIPNE